MNLRPDAGDAALARAVADEAGRQLMRVRERLHRDGAPSWVAEDTGDAAGQRSIEEALAVHRPHDAVLSEEATDDDARMSADRVWIVDPLDGTREYGELDRSDWAVHVALWERRDGAGNRSDDGSLTAGAVALPAVGIVLATDEPPVVPPLEGRRPRIVVSRSRAPRLAFEVADAVGCDMVTLGSAGAKTMAVVLGDADIYLHAGGMHQWDSAAPVAVAAAAGLHTSRLDGSPLVYNRRDTWLPDLLVCRQELARQVLEVVNGGRLGA
jgi:3'(2'), 5'-bisphosphate nucleotidase